MSGESDCEKCLQNRVCVNPYNSFYTILDYYIGALLRKKEIHIDLGLTRIIH